MNFLSVVSCFSLLLVAATSHAPKPCVPELLTGGVNVEVMYEIDWTTQSCRKLPLEAYFMPTHVPADAILIGQAVLGSSSSWGMGLLTNTWGGQFQNKDTYSSVFTEIGCLPVTLTSYSPKSGWTTISTYNRVIGLSNPMDFIPPSFCDAAEIEKSAKPHTVFSAMESLAAMKVKSVE